MEENRQVWSVPELELDVGSRAHDAADEVADRQKFNHVGAAHRFHFCERVDVLQADPEAVVLDKEKPYIHGKYY